MNDKRLQIMESAIHCFSNKGYFATSVQEIADDCGISKGLLYKHFDSKEDLLIEVFKYNHEKMVKKARLIKLDSTLSNHQLLKGMVIIELEGLIENKDFFNVLSKSLPVDKNKEVFQLMKQLRGELMNWHKDSIEQAYGVEVKEHIWDITVVLQAMIKEFVFLLTQRNLIIDIDKVADFIVGSIDAIVRNGASLPSVLTSEMMEEFDNLQKGITLKSLPEKIEEIIEQMKEIVSRRSEGMDNQQDINDSIMLLDEELKKNEPRVFLIRALLTYLDENPELLNHVKMMKKILDLK